MGLREEFDAALDHIADLSRPFTLADGFAYTQLAGRFKVEVWPDLTDDERAAYQARTNGLAAQARARKGGGAARV